MGLVPASLNELAKVKVEYESKRVLFQLSHHATVRVSHERLDV